MERLLITGLGKQDVIFGLPWFQEYNPSINWITGKITFPVKLSGFVLLYSRKDRQWRQETKNVKTTTIQQLEQEEEQQETARREYNCIRKEMEAASEQLQPKKPKPSDSPNWRIWELPPKEDKEILSVSIQHLENDMPDLITLEEEEEDTLIAHITGKTWEDWMEINKTTVSTTLAMDANAQKKEKTLEEMVPPELMDYRHIFDKTTANRFPESRPWDHAIDLKEDFVPKDCKVYPLTVPEQAELDKFLNENLEKGYIWPSKSPMASLFFFVDKKDSKLQPTQDYCLLNKGTIKNTYPLPLVSELIDKLKGAKYFTKLDIWWGYNNVRIKDGDQWKAAFKTNCGLFEPTVMFFGLCNSPATFQAMMDAIFKEELDKGWLIIYMDDMLIVTQTEEENIKFTW